MYGVLDFKDICPHPHYLIWYYLQIDSGPHADPAREDESLLHGQEAV